MSNGAPEGTLTFADIFGRKRRRAVSKRFNKLRPDEEERLAILAEECAEVTQCICKVLRHGYASRNPLKPDSPDNREHLQEEAGHLLAAIQRMLGVDLERSCVEDSRMDKMRSIGRWLHHNDAKARGDEEGPSGSDQPNGDGTTDRNGEADK